MAHRAFRDRIRLANLAWRIAFRRETLGVGLHNGCWGAVAIGIAHDHGAKTTDYFGLSMREIKAAIKENGKIPPPTRNLVMALRTLQAAVRPGYDVNTPQSARMKMLAS